MTCEHCDQCGRQLTRGMLRAGISYSHTIGPDGQPLSDEPLPESRHFCSRQCLDRWDEEHQGAL